MALAGRALTRFQIFHSSAVICARSSGVRTSTNTMPLTSLGCWPAKTRAIVPLKECATRDVRARYVGRLQQGDEVVDPVLRAGRLAHRVAAAESLIEVRRTGSVVGAHPRCLLNVVVDRRTLLISSVPQVRCCVRTRDEQHGG